MNFIKGILTEDNGNFSSKRYIAVSWFTLVIFVWAIVSLKSLSLIDIPNGIYMMSGVIAGMLAVGKFGEQKV